MSPEIIIEASEDPQFSKISLSNYDHIPNKTKYNTDSVFKKKDFSTETIEPVLNFEVFQDDVWIITHPKCGTTWTQEMAWLIMNNMDFEQAKKIDLETRSPFLESSLKVVENCKTLSRPRVIKSHEKMQLLPKQLWTKNPKIIFVVRDPKDVFISFYHHNKFFYGRKFEEDQVTFIESRMKYGNFWEQVLSFYALRTNENVLFLSFEEMKKNLKSVVLRVSKFLGKNYNEIEIDRLVEHLDFKNMKNNPSCGHNKEVEEFRKRKNITEEDILEK
ncbi:hypothetical protein ACFFRR_011830 [Megaselia abdita]